ncbi:MFS transporter [Rossellomorea sp. LjRoot5]|uniref:MFS transporter n=1 Tax=Rossellomorea sp. LjRoot5 TaxID=3342331 RepID=UPI003ED09DA2
MKKRYGNILLLINFTDGLVSSTYALAILYFMQLNSNSIFKNSVIANLGSIALICVTLLLGAFIDRKSSKFILITANLIMFIIAWIPGQFVSSAYFFLIVLIVDLVVTLLNLMISITSEAFIKLIISEENMSRYVSVSSGLVMLGTISGIVFLYFGFDNIRPQFIFLLMASVFLLNVLLSLLLPNKKVVKHEGEKISTWEELKEGIRYMKSSTYQKNNLLLYTILGTIHTVSSSLIIYYWAQVDKQFIESSFLLYGLGIGIAVGVVLTNVIKKHNLTVLWIFSILISLALFSLTVAHTPLMLSAVFGSILGFLVVPLSILKTVRIKRTTSEMQARVLSMNRMFIAILSLAVVMIFGAVGEFTGFIYAPMVFLGVLNIIGLIVFSIRDSKDSFTQHVGELEMSSSVSE